MKKIVLLFVILVMSFSCKNSSESASQSTYMRKFNKMSMNEKIKYINTLKGNKVGEFFNEFLPEAIFRYPPNETVKFYKDGTIIVSSIDNNYKDILISYWKITNNSLKIWKKENRIPFPINRNEEYKLQFVQRGDSDNPKSIEMVFIDQLTGQEIGLIYENHIKINDLRYDAIEYYEKKVKSIKSTKK